MQFDSCELSVLTRKYLYFSQNYEQPQHIQTYAQCVQQSSEHRSSNQSYHTNGVSSIHVPSATTLEPCKHSMSSTKNDQSPTKATTVTN